MWNLGGKNRKAEESLALPSARFEFILLIVPPESGAPCVERRSGDAQSDDDELELPNNSRRSRISSIE
jgi:hypothetical protein